MGKGYESNQERLNTLATFGKDLARRAKSKCELSQKSGVPLKIYEVPPNPKEPDFSRCLMLSEETIAQINRPKNLNANDWRHLGELIWSEEAMVQLMTIRILIYLGKEHSWCQELIDDAYLDEEVLEAAAAAPIN